MNPILPFGRVSLSLVEPVRLLSSGVEMPVYVGIFGSLIVKVEKLPWGRWCGSISIDRLGMVKSCEPGDENEKEVVRCLSVRAEKLCSELQRLLL